MEAVGLVATSAAPDSPSTPASPCFFASTNVSAPVSRRGGRPRPPDRVCIRGVEAARHVDVRAVGAHHERVRPAEPIDAAYPVTLHPTNVSIRSQRRGGTPPERCRESPSRNVRAVGTDGDGRREGQALDPRHAVPLHLHGHETVARPRHRRRGNRDRERQADQWKCRDPHRPIVTSRRPATHVRSSSRRVTYHADGRGVN